MKNWYLEELNDKWLKQAKVDNVDGCICSFCGKENDFADDCGWFYIYPDNYTEGYACKACFYGEPGEKHHQRYGWGER